jgi:serine/threonine protein phosphatase PrpC
MLRAAGTCVTGPAHLSAGHECQDALSLRGWQGGWIAAVADGLGSRSQSARGAKLAVQSAQAVVRRGSGRTSVWRNTPARDVATEIYRRWLAAVPWLDKSCAATTLLVAVCDWQGYVRIWQLGDGLILSQCDGQLVVVTPERIGFGNETRAMGVHKAWSDWHHASMTLNGKGDAVLLMTDGISDDLPQPVLQHFARTVQQQLKRRSRRQGRIWLTHELLNWATPGHADDKTLAAIFLD